MLLYLVMAEFGAISITDIKYAFKKAIHIVAFNSKASEQH